MLHGVGNEVLFAITAVAAATLYIGVNAYLNRMRAGGTSAGTTATPPAQHVQNDESPVVLNNAPLPDLHLPEINDPSAVRVRVLTGTRQLSAHVPPTTTMRTLAAMLFAVEMEHGQSVTFLHRGARLEDHHTIPALPEGADEIVLHAVVRTQVAAPPTGGAQQARGGAPEVAFSGLGNFPVLRVVWSFMVAAGWFFAFHSPHFFSIISTIFLSIITAVLLLAWYIWFRPATAPNPHAHHL